MRRVVKRKIAVVAAAVVGIPVLLFGIALIAANTDPGRRMAEALATRASGGTVRVEGLTGRFPDAPRIRKLAIADQEGVYLTIDNASLDWSPWRLISRLASIQRLDADRVELSRLPGAAAGSASDGGMALPVRVSLERLRITRVDIGAAVAGQAFSLTVDGSGELVSLHQADVRLDVTSLAASSGGTPDSYTIQASIDPARLRAKLGVREGPHGLLATMATLPDLGSITADATVEGPMSALATRLHLELGQLRADAEGSIDAVGRAADLSVSASAPAMEPRPGLSWKSVALSGHVHGPFAGLDATGKLEIDGLTAADGRISQVQADISANAGQVRVNARVDGLRVPGPRPQLLADGPVTLDATIRLDQPELPVTFSLRQKLLNAEGSALAGDAKRVQMRLALPDLAPFAAVGGMDVEGRATLDLNAAQSSDGTLTLIAKGKVDIAGGTAPLPSLVASAGTIDLEARLKGQAVELKRLVMAGKAFNASASGQFADNQVDLAWRVRLADLSAIQHTLSGAVDAEGRIRGAPAALALTGDVTGDVAAQGARFSRFKARMDVRGLPGAPTGRVSADGEFLDAPLSLAVAAELRDGKTHVTIKQANWKSLHAEGSLALPAGASMPTGTLRIAMASLGDLSPLLGRAITGSMSATVDVDPSSARIAVDAKQVAIPGTVSIANATLGGTVSELAGNPSVDATLVVSGANAAGIQAAGRLTAKGPTEALAVGLATDIADLHGAPARLEASGTLAAAERILSLASLHGTWKQETVRLLAPVRIGFADGVSIDRLRIGLRKAELTVAGRAGSTLDLTATLRNLPADIAAIVAPAYAADGQIAAEARLTGTPARPDGTVRVTATGIRMRQGPAQTLPPANLTLGATLSGESARLDGRLTAGTSNVTVAGTAPLNAAERMDLRVGGMIDLVMLDPALAAQGRRVRGRLNLDLGLAGTPVQPVVSGTARLANGDVQDFAIGAHVSDIDATIQGDGETIRLTRLSGKAGPGTIDGTGTLGLAGTMPIDIRLRADNARPLSSDLLSALIDANLTLTGALKGDLALGGTVHVRHADIRVPERLPASIVVLEVRNAGSRWEPPPPPPPPPPPAIGLDLTLDAPEEVFIRGQGLDVELGGRIEFRGTADRPVPTGGLNLRRGTINVAGQTLTMTAGTIDFSGGGLTDPDLNLVASSTSASLTASLTVGGSVRKPKITLSSTPDMPQDEILSQLLFNTNKSKLSPLQVAQVGAALAALAGGPSVIGSTLDSARTSLGLDRLSVGSDASGAPTVEGGRYLAPGVYMGAKQSTTGAGTQATVQIDIAKGLKVEATAGAASTSATGSAGAADAASVGVTYQFEY